MSLKLENDRYLKWGFQRRRSSFEKWVMRIENAVRNERLRLLAGAFFFFIFSVAAIFSLDLPHLLTRWGENNEMKRASLKANEIDGRTRLEKKKRISIFSTNVAVLNYFPA